MTSSAGPGAPLRARRRRRAAHGRGLPPTATGVGP